MTIEVITRYEKTSEYTLKFYLDSEEVLERVIQVDPEDVPRGVDVTIDLNISPGKHQLEANLTGLLVDTDETHHLETQFINIWRMAESSWDTEVSVFVEEGGLLLLDPYVDVVLDGMYKDMGLWGRWDIEVIAWPGTSLTIENLTTTGGGTIELEVSGPCDLRIANVTITSDLTMYNERGPKSLIIEDSNITYQYIDGPMDPVIYRNVSLGSSTIVLSGGRLSMNNITSQWSAWWWLVNGGDIEIQNSTLGGGISLYPEKCNISIVDTTLKGEPLGLLEVKMEDRSTLEMRNCIIDDFIVTLDLANWSWAANLTDCVFTGTESMLEVTFTGSHTEFFNEQQFLGLPGTIFDEASTGIFAHYTTVEHLAEADDLPPSVPVIAMYRPLFMLVGTNEVLGPHNLTMRREGDLLRDPLDLEGWQYDKLTLFVDVTTDPSKASEPREVHLALLTNYHVDRYADPLPWVSDIMNIDMTSLRVEVQYTEWDDVDELVVDYLDGGPTAVP
ncbi:MAG: hypothetical protein GQ558_11165 [Thermoplasmata archaeon]|nr:hypothetical protein [Thermoplasmata archaeon]